MGKSFEHLSGIGFLLALLGFGIWISKKTDKETDFINVSGVEVRARVNRVFYARGYDLDVEYFYNGRRYVQFVMVKNSDYKAGDSVLLKVQPENIDGLVLYKKCIYKMPR